MYIGKLFKYNEYKVPNEIPNINIDVKGNLNNSYKKIINLIQM